MLCFLELPAQLRSLATEAQEFRLGLAQAFELRCIRLCLSQAQNFFPHRIHLGGVRKQAGVVRPQLSDVLLLPKQETGSAREQERGYSEELGLGHNHDS